VSGEQTDEQTDRQTVLQWLKCVTAIAAVARKNCKANCGKLDATANGLKKLILLLHFFNPAIMSPTCSETYLKIELFPAAQNLEGMVD